MDCFFFWIGASVSHLPYAIAISNSAFKQILSQNLDSKAARRRSEMGACTCSDRKGGKDGQDGFMAQMTIDPIAAGSGPTISREHLASQGLLVRKGDQGQIQLDRQDWRPM